MGAPLGAIIAMGTVAGLIIILLTAVNPVGTAIGFVLATVALLVVLLCYLWLDRWEPEPPRLLVLAFLWGASVAVVVSIGLELFFGTLFPTDEADTGGFITLAVGAPIIEEALKGVFLLIMMTGLRRNEMNSLTDCLVYAGLTAAGFAWVENIAYIGGGEDLGGSLITAALRLIMGPFAHPLFTTFTGIGVYFALHQRNSLAKAGCILLGYLGAVIMHGLWNGSSVVGIEAYFLVYVFWMVPIFVLAIVLARAEPPSRAAHRHGEAAEHGGGRPGHAQRGDVARLDQDTETGRRRGDPAGRKGGGKVRQGLRRPGGRVGLRARPHRPRIRRRARCRPCSTRRPTECTRHAPPPPSFSGSPPTALPVV